MRQIAEDYGQAWNSHDLDQIMARHTEDTTFRLHLLGAPAVTGQEAVRDAFAGLLTFWPDMRFTTEELVFGNDFFVHQYVFTATLAAPLPLGAVVYEPTGQPIAIGGVDVITVAGNLVWRKETYLDIAAAQQQLGALG